MDNSAKLAILCANITEDMLRTAMREWKEKEMCMCSEETQLIHPLYTNALNKVGICMYRYLVRFDFNIQDILKEFERDGIECTVYYSVFKTLNDSSDKLGWLGCESLIQHIIFLYENSQSINGLIEDIKDNFEHTFR